MKGKRETMNVQREVSPSRLRRRKSGAAVEETPPSVSDATKNEKTPDASAENKEDIGKFQDKRKMELEEDLIQPKRKCQLPVGADKNDSERSDEDELSVKENLMVSQLRELLETETEEFEESQSRFAWEFWKSLHANHGSTFGYLFGFLMLLLLNHEWMIEEFADIAEGHSVSKTFVVLFLFFGYSVITFGFELIQLILLISEVSSPGISAAFGSRLKPFFEEHRKLEKVVFSQYFKIFLASLWCMLLAVAGSTFWNWFWWNHICKSYNDRTCRKSWLGKLVISYRDEACYDGTASSAVCEKFVSYLPVMILCVVCVFIANVFFPLLNDRLSLYYPLSTKLQKACKIMDNLNSDQIKEIDENEKNRDDRDHYHDFSLTRKNLNFGGKLEKRD